MQRRFVIILTLMLAAASIGQATVFNQTIKPGGGGTYTTFGAAIAWLQAQSMPLTDTYDFAADVGTYSEAITITAQTTGAGFVRFHTDGTGYATLSTGTAQSIYFNSGSLQNRRITMENIIATGGTYGVRVNNSKYVTLRKCQVVGAPTTYGIYAANGPRLTLDSVDVSASVGAAGYGVYVTTTSDTFRARHLTVSGSGVRGISVQSLGARLDTVTVTSGTAHGIYVTTSRGAQLNGCVVNGAFTTGGITVENSDFAVVGGSVVTLNANAAGAQLIRMFQSDTSVVRRCSVATAAGVTTSRAGILIKGSSDTRVDTCSVTAAATYGIHDTLSPRSAVRGCNVTGTINGAPSSGVRVEYSTDVTIGGTAAAAMTGFSLNSSSDRFVVQSCSTYLGINNGVVVNACNNGRILDTRIPTSGNVGINLVSSDGCAIRRCVLGSDTRTSPNNGIWVASGCDNDTISDCQVFTNGPTGIRLFGGASPVSTGHYVANNMIAGWYNYGIYLANLSGVSLLDNTILGPDVVGATSAYCINLLPSAVGVTAQNNALYNQGGPGAPSVASACYFVPAGAGFAASDYNDLYSTQDAVMADGVSSTKDLAQWQAFSLQDAHSIAADPQFVDVTLPLPFDVHIQAESPCRWKATPIAGITADIDGDTRGSFHPCIGADEFTRIDVGALAVLAPTGSVDSADVVVPQCRVVNLGNTVQDYNVRLKVAPDYNHTFAVTNHHEGETLLVTLAQSWTALLRGSHTVTCTTELATDTVAGNNRVTGSVFVRAHDAGTDAITTPVNNAVIAPGTQITPAATVHNYGNVTENIPVTFAFSGYSDPQTANSVAPGATANPTFTPTTPAPGYYTMTATTSLAGDGNAGNDVQTGNFLVMGQPVGLVPNGGWLTTPAVVLDWDDLAGIATYDVYVDNNSDFSSPEFSQTGLTVSSTTTSALADGHYYWHVTGWNNLFGPWSATAQFDLDASVPGQATLLTPTDHATDVALQPAFTWTQVTFDKNSGLGSARKLTDASPVAYEIQVATDGGFSNVVVDQSGLTDETYTPGTALGYETQYFWHIKASDGAGNIGPWSSAFDFTTITAAPAAPVLASPPDLATDVAVSGDLTWNAAARAVTYDVYLDTLNPPVVKIGDNVTVLTQAYTGLINSRTYYWQVEARNVGGTTLSAVWSFTTIVAAPAAPVLVAPADLATDVAVDGDVQWSAAARATAYDVYLGTANPPATLLAGDVTGMSQAYVGLAHNRVYYWQVKAKNVGGTALSAVWSFTTDPGLPGGWYAKPNVAGAATFVKDGGAMAYNADNSLIYEMKGNKTFEFNSYNPADSTWTVLAPIPAGLKAVKGGASMATGAGKVFVTKGNNTLEFYRYDIATSAWLPVTVPVPLGAGKKVKAGGSMAFVSKPEGAGDFVYMLKGYGTEFYRYDVANDSFTPLANAPDGIKPKYDKGSWIAYDGAQYIYVNKAKYGEFYKYDVLAEAWVTAPVLPGMPLLNPSSNKNKKVGDGSSAAFGNDALYAFKGNNVNVFWKYTPGGTWAELETVPQVAHTGDKKKKVKAGAAVVYYAPDNVFYAQKGNKSNQFWQYKPGTSVVYETRPTRDGVAAAGRLTIDECRLSIAPNPVVGSRVLRVTTGSLDGLATVSIYDALGRLVLTRPLGHSTTSLLDVRSLSAGVYLVKLFSDNYTTSQKLVIEE